MSVNSVSWASLLPYTAMMKHGNNHQLIVSLLHLLRNGNILYEHASPHD
jgi:hypothetical protein